MTDTRVQELLDVLAETAPEPSPDMVDAVHRSAGLRRRMYTRRPARRLVPALVAVATVVALLAAAGVAVLTGRSQSAAPATPPSPSAAEAALSAGTRLATVFFSPDYRTLDTYDAQVAAGSTGTFRSDFVAKEDRLHDLLTQVHSSAQGQVLASAVRDSTPTTATVLLVADQYVRESSTHGKAVTNRYRVAEKLRLVDGRWLAESLEPVTGGPYAGGCPDATATPALDDLLRQTCAAVGTLYSYDYRHIDSDLAAQRALATGTLQQSLIHDTGPALQSLAPKTKAVVRAEPSTAAVEHVDGNTARVLLFLDQTVTSDAVRTPRLDRNRVEATMQRVGDRWVVADVRAL